ncbi:MAG TPA: hypothetical protein VGC41_21370 [Kofleriaceae bacterium]
MKHLWFCVLAACSSQPGTFYGLDGEVEGLAPGASVDLVAFIGGGFDTYTFN